MTKRNIMQAIGSILLICILILMINPPSGNKPTSEVSAAPSATGSVSQPPADQTTATQEPAAAATPAPASTSAIILPAMGEKVLLDQDGIKITLKSINNDNVLGPAIEVLAENTTLKGVTIQVKHASVNGAMVDSQYSCDVAAKSKVNDEIILLARDLETAGIDKIRDIEFYFSIADRASQENIFDSAAITLNTGVSVDQEYDDSGIEVFNEDGVRVVIKNENSDESVLGKEIYAYIENNTDKDLIIQTRDVSVNDVPIQPIISCNIMAGKIAYDDLTFLKNEMDDNGIQAIETLQLTIAIIDMHAWDSVIYSDMIEVSLGSN